jgi:carbamate kinase
MNNASSERIVIALGGNALSPPEGRGEIREQREAIRRSAEQIARILKGSARVVLTHGNGPQVGQLLIQQEEARRLVPPLPLDVCVAMTQGEIGYLLQQSLQSALKTQGLAIPVVTVVTQVLVDPNDPAFEEPTKPVGPFYSEREAEELRMTKGYVLRRVGNGEKPYRRVVPSPRPIEIVERGCIDELVRAGHVVIACGGGGVPVIPHNGQLEGVEAVIDKDLASERLATALGAHTLLILTDVERVVLHYDTPEQIELETLTVEEAKRHLADGEFPPGSMGPKIEAAVRFLENGGRRAIIASLEQAQEALAGRAGTEIISPA